MTILVRFGMSMTDAGKNPPALGSASALDEFGIAYEIDVTSAHRSPDRTAEYARKAAGRGIRRAVRPAGAQPIQP